MNCFVHDFAGHPFQAQLSRELARRGHLVTHAFPIGLDGPKGRLEPNGEDPEGLTISGVPLSGTFKKYSPHRRLLAQRKYARDLKNLLLANPPDVLLSGNTPIDVQAELLLFCKRHNIAFVHWVQDVYCHALEFILRRKLGSLSRLASLPFLVLEKTVTKRSEEVVVISPAFRTLLTQWGVAAEKVTTIENWAPLDEMPCLSRENAWAREQGLIGKTVFLYSGTLGLKHRPDLLYALAKSLEDKVTVVVVSEGMGREYLEAQPRLSNLVLMNFQPYDRLPEVLGSADVLLATLESDAGQFAVPSKILSYLCAGRPVLLAAPPNNLACSVISRSNSGIAVDANDSGAWLKAATELTENASLRSMLSTNARKYAETAFDVKRVATNFETVLISACDSRNATPSVQTVQSQAQN